MGCPFIILMTQAYNYVITHVRDKEQNNHSKCVNKHFINVN